MATSHGSADDMLATDSHPPRHGSVFLCVSATLLCQVLKKIIVSRYDCYLNLHKLSFALVANLQESFTSHILHPRMRLMHELKQLIHDCLQELPVVAEESGILAHHIPAHKHALKSAPRRIVY